MKDRNAEGLSGSNGGQEQLRQQIGHRRIIMFRKMIKALSVICHVRVLGKEDFSR